MALNKVVGEFAKDAPIAGLATAKLFGLTLNEWVLVLGVVYGVVRIGVLLVEAYWSWKDRRDRKSK